MAEFEIKDGWGTGQRARVTKQGQLYALSEAYSPYAFASKEDHRAFVAASGEILIPAGTSQYIWWCKNPDPNIEIYIISVDISTNAVGKVQIDFDMERSSGGSGITPTNLDRTSNVRSVLTASYCFAGADLTLTGTPANYSTFRVPANVPFREKFDGAVILGHNNTLAVMFTPDTDASVYVSVKYFEMLKRA